MNSFLVVGLTILWQKFVKSSENPTEDKTSTSKPTKTGTIKSFASKIKQNLKLKPRGPQKVEIETVDNQNRKFTFKIPQTMCKNKKFDEILLQIGFSKPFQCDSCQEEFVETKSEDCQKSSFTCTECSKEFTATRSVKEHIETVHEGVKNFKCQECEKEFAESSNLKVHIKEVHK